MSEVLSADQIAALFEAAKSGTVPETSPTAAPPRRSQRVRLVDFSRPTKFTADHQRRLLRTVETFDLAASNRLSAELRATVELETINNAQVTWMAAQALAPPHSLLVMLSVTPTDGRILLTVEREFMLTAIECLLGGTTDRAPKIRRFSEIDWTLSRRILEAIVSNLSATWHDFGSLSLEIEDVDLDLDATMVAPVSEPTFVVMIEARLNGLSSTMTLMVPWSAIDQVANTIAGQDLNLGHETDDPGFGRVLADVPVTLRAEVAAVEMEIGSILDLQVGSVIRLGAPADAGVSVFVENTAIGRASPGSHGSRRAIQMLNGPEALA